MRRVSSCVVDPTQLAVAYLVTITTAVAVVMVVTLYTMVRQPHLRPGLGALLLVALPSQLIFATLLWGVSSSLGGGWRSYHPTAIDSCVCMFSCVALLAAPLVHLRLFRAPKVQRVPRPLTVAHGIIWAFTVLLICLLTSGGS